MKNLTRTLIICIMSICVLLTFVGINNSTDIEAISTPTQTTKSTTNKTTKSTEKHKTTKSHKKTTAKKHHKKHHKKQSNKEYIGTFEITAYSYDEGGGENYETAGGYTPSPYYTVAVDPDVISLGMILYIQGIGTVQAQDTGSAVQGNHIDLHVGYDDPDDFGTQYHKVYVIR